MMTERKIIIFLVFLLSGCFTAAELHGQAIVNKFISYTTKHGLLEGAIDQIIQDSQGFLWLACEGGILRFDGYSFKRFIYDPNDSNAIREPNTTNMFIDSKGRLWALSPHWINLYHPETQTFEHTGINTLTSDYLYKICGEENGKLMITGTRQLYRFDIANKRFDSFLHVGALHRHYYDYLSDSNGNE